MKHHTLPLFASPVTQLEIDLQGVTSFFDTLIKPSQGRRNSDGTENYRTALLHYHNDQNVFEIYEELKDLGERILTAANFVYRMS